MADDDWRLTDQERYLAGRVLHWSVWSPFREGWDHDHCAFCWAEISDQPIDEHTEHNAAWASEDNYHWICPNCFDDFRDQFAWVTSGVPSPASCSTLSLARHAQRRHSEAVGRIVLPVYTCE